MTYWGAEDLGKNHITELQNMLKTHLQIFKCCNMWTIILMLLYNIQMSKYVKMGFKYTLHLVNTCKNYFSSCYAV